MSRLQPMEQKPPTRLISTPNTAYACNAQVNTGVDIFQIQSYKLQGIRA